MIFSIVFAHGSFFENKGLWNRVCAATVAGLPRGRHVPQPEYTISFTFVTIPRNGHWKQISRVYNKILILQFFLKDLLSGNVPKSSIFRGMNRGRIDYDGHNTAQRTYTGRNLVVLNHPRPD